MSAMSPDQAADVELAAASGCQRHGTVATEPVACPGYRMLGEPHSSNWQCHIPPHHVADLRMPPSCGGLGVAGAVTKATNRVAVKAAQASTADLGSARNASACTVPLHSLHICAPSAALSPSLICWQAAQEGDWTWL